ncbi:Glutathione peroxidase 2 [Orbilia javanica]
MSSLRRCHPRLLRPLQSISINSRPSTLASLFATTTIHNHNNHNNNIHTTARKMSSATALDFYSYKPLDKKGEEYDLSQLKGKVVLIVNVASKCGFTPQYEGLEKLYAKYQDRGLVVLGFPCNQFGGQAPGTSEEQVSFCTLTYGVKFPVLGKIEVNGDKAHPLYEWLKKEKPGLLGMKRIKWNFEKFLISRDGKVVERWASTTSPASLTPRIEEELNKPEPTPAATGPSDTA